MWVKIELEEVIDKDLSYTWPVHDVPAMWIDLDRLTTDRLLWVDNEYYITLNWVNYLQAKIGLQVVRARPGCIPVGQDAVYRITEIVEGEE